MAVAHDLPLLTMLAAGLSVAFVAGLTASKLRIPPIVGYLLAGIIIGPHTPGYVGDEDIAVELSEIGIVLLMFGVGLHFSVKDLMEVRRIAIPGAIVQIAAATSMGAALAYFWDWPLKTGLLFGLALSVASTVVLLRALEQQKILQTMNGHIAIGWLIVEDLVMVLALVMIPALAVSKEGADMGDAALSLATAIGKVVLFAVVMMVAGRRLLPMILNTVAKTRSRELFTLAVFVSALGIAYGAAELFGVSFALGAFFAGMMIRESDLNHEVAERALPFQDAFAVLFFVSVGMLFDPDVLFERPLDVLAVVGIVIIGRSIAASVIVLLLHYPLRTALLVSAGLAQIGEFSFILVTIGMSYNILSQESSDLILAAALISIAINPLVFNAVHGLHGFVGKRPHLSRRFKMHEEELALLGRETKKNLSGHVILVGYGRVGKQICRDLKDDDFNLVIIDNNRERIITLRDKGLTAIVGDASTSQALMEANIETAAAIVVAVPDSFEARNIVECARTFHPSITVLVRAHNDEERDYFVGQEVNMVSTGSRELARAMTRYLRERVPS